MTHPLRAHIYIALCGGIYVKNDNTILFYCIDLHHISNDAGCGKSEPVQQVTTFDTFELPEWFKISFLDLSEDNLEAVESNKHLVVFFWQDFCGYCKDTIEKNLTQQSIRELFDEHFDVVALNIWGSKEVFGLDGKATTEKEIARALEVQFTPTIIFFDSNGKPVLRLNGYVSPAEMGVALNYVHTERYHSQTIFEYLGPTNLVSKRFSKFSTIYSGWH